MKKYETLLFNKLNHAEQDEPLKHVRSALGSLGYAKGNPLSKTEISIQVTLRFFDVSILGAGIEIPPAALPVALQTSLPCFLFSLTDYYGSFIASRLINILPNPWGVGVGGVNGIVGFGVNPWVSPLGVQPALLGDLQLIYFFNVFPVSVIAVISVHCNNVSYGTFLNSFVSDLITISVLRMIVPPANILQFTYPIHVSTQSLFGKVVTDNIDPRMYITPKDFQAQIADIPFNLPIDKTLMVGFNIDIFCQMISFVLFVEKIEPLIYKRNRHA